MKRTPLFAAHHRLGGKLIEFGGWEMPVLYTSIIEEHLAVRKAAGIFDISHMGEVCISGPEAESVLNQTLTNDARKLAVGQGQYTLMCDERGGAIDDLYAYRLATDEYLLIINAARITADVAWLERQLAGFGRHGGARLEDLSEATGAVAVQGPRVAEFVTRVFPGASTGGTQSPSLGIGIGLGYVPPEFSKPQTPIEIEIRGKPAPAVVVAKPIYRKAD